MIGPIRQEILSGYGDLKKFKKLREKLSFMGKNQLAFTACRACL
jgi:hypothetical protein